MPNTEAEPDMKVLMPIFSSVGFSAWANAGRAEREDSAKASRVARKAGAFDMVVASCGYCFCTDASATYNPEKYSEQPHLTKPAFGLGDRRTALTSRLVAV